MKLQYIEGTNDGCILYYDQSEVLSNHTPLYEVKKLCIEHLKTYEGVKNASKKMLLIPYMVPIYISKEMVLAPISSPRNYDSIWVNVTEVTYFSQNYLFFHGGKAVSITKTRWNTIYSRYEMLVTYLEKCSML